MLSVVEKEIAITHSMEYFNNPNGKLLFKVLANYLSSTTELNKELSSLTEDIFTDRDKMQICAEKMIAYMTNVASRSKVYTTGQLARYFGVSITSINNWITEGRFVNLPPRGENKQSRIPDGVLWKSPIEELIPVYEIVDLYNSQLAQPTTPKQELKDIATSISFFEKKYSGSLETTLLKKEDKTTEELRDEAEWEYLVRRLKA